MLFHLDANKLQSPKRIIESTIYFSATRSNRTNRRWQRQRRHSASFNGKRNFLFGCALSKGKSLCMRTCQIAHSCYKRAICKHFKNFEHGTEQQHTSNVYHQNMMMKSIFELTSSRWIFVIMLIGAWWFTQTKSSGRWVVHACRMAEWVAGTAWTIERTPTEHTGRQSEVMDNMHRSVLNHIRVIFDRIFDICTLIKLCHDMHWSIVYAHTRQTSAQLSKVQTAFVFIRFEGICRCNNSVPTLPSFVRSFVSFGSHNHTKYFHRPVAVDYADRSAFKIGIGYLLYP